MDEQSAWITTHPRHGSLDGGSAGDHDQPFAGYRAYQFNTLQIARMLQLRSEVLEARLGHGRFAADLVGSGM